MKENKLSFESENLRFNVSVQKTYQGEVHAIRYDPTNNHYVFRVGLTFMTNVFYDVVVGALKFIPV